MEFGIKLGGAIDIGGLKNNRSFSRSLAIEGFWSNIFKLGLVKISVLDRFGQYKNVPPFLRSEVFHDQLNQQQK